ncbi:hypothetical protein A9323_20690 [Yersinia pestis]|uniref:Uncharacterized protein n=2 Tax=Yersinia pestis TaxID=632 RepID=A0A0K1H0Q1_YERPE|nr:hypothetical protein [Yersinia pestis]MBE7778941.1 hypothetical protein [Yersinia pestis]MBE7783608.1 hypothetical protein [Yersinia pestis]MBE7787252.1 hypothetical protein [Yersinia pestis]MBE7803614.1 hypothetical protein [Yersinia pestis]
MIKVFCKVRSAKWEWLMQMSCQERLFVDNYGDKHELNPLNDENPCMDVQALISRGELYVLTNYQ